MLITESRLRRLIRGNLVRSMLNENDLKPMKDDPELQKFCEKFGIPMKKMYETYPNADDFWRSEDGRNMISQKRNGIYKDTQVTKGDQFLLYALEDIVKQRGRGEDPLFGSVKTVEDLWDVKTGRWTELGVKMVRNTILDHLQKEDEKITEKVQRRLIAEAAIQNMVEFRKQVATEEEDIKAFFNNLILVLEDCKKTYPKVWNPKIIDDEIGRIIYYIRDDETIIGEFDEFIEDLMSESLTFKRNYPTEIILNNIVSERVEEFQKMCGGGADDSIPGKGHFRDELSRKNMSIDPRPISKRVWKTLMVRGQNKKKKAKK